jgi:hypothetical protein
VGGRDYDLVTGLLTARAEAATNEYSTEKGIRQTFGIANVPYQWVKQLGIVNPDDGALYDFMLEYDTFMTGNNVMAPVMAAYNTYWGDMTTLCDEYQAQLK